jgi:hypothetical protein
VPHDRDIDRRQLLKSATGIAAGAIAFPYIVPSSALGRAGSVAPSNRIVMGCIGMGGMGTGDMRGFLSKSQVQVVVVCDVDKNQRDKARKSSTVNTRTMTARRIWIFGM